MPKPFKSEAELQKLLERAVKRDDLGGLINDIAQIEELSARDSDVQFPQFAIDHLTRQYAIQAGAKVLTSLTCLTLLTSDQNVSLTSGEVLRPDLTCINPEQQSVVLIELKKEGQTGRQSLTELLAYEQEIKNHLPLLSDYDFNFVLISPEWTPLMDHAVSAAIAWSGRKILCLTATREKRKLRLETRIPSAWKVTGAVHFPADAMPSVTVCLYDRDLAETQPEEADADPQSEENNLDPRIWTAMEIMAREGDRLGGHGFALLWQDFHGLSQTSYNITVCGVAPFAFYRESRERGIIALENGRLVAHLDQFVRDHDPTGHSDSLMATATAAKPLLEEVASVSLEGFSTWDVDRRALSRRARPMLCEFWGVLGEYARSYVMNPAVRTHRRSTLQGGMSDWRDPRVGLPLIQSFTRPEIFYEGEIRCSDAFRFGILWGLDRSYRFSLRKNDHPALRCRFLWNRIELMTAIDEIRLLADAADNVEPPEEPLHFYEDPLVDDDAESARALRWIAIEVFQDAPIHKLFLQVGIHGSLIFEERKRGLWGEKIPADWIDNVEADLRRATGIILSLYKQLEDEGGLWGELPTHFEWLRRALGLRKNFAVKRVADLSVETLLSAWDACLAASNLVVDTVYHHHAPVAPTTIDWDWLKQGVAEMRLRGEYDGGVVLLPSGQIVTGPVLPDGMKIKLKIDDPDEQVPFLDRSHGIGLMRIVTWTDLMSGAAFERKSNNDPTVPASDDPVSDPA